MTTTTTTTERPTPQARAGTAPAARAVGAVKVYGRGEAQVRALDDVTVDFEGGRFTAIMGPSGSGKSTLMHTLAGLDTLTSGSVWIGDTDLSTLDDRRLTRLRRDRVGFVFQQFNLIPTLTAAENIELPMRLARRRPDRAWVDEVVATVGLGRRLTHRPSELSGGQQQRVAVARALASRPEIVFADEPTGNLDSRTGAEILSFMRTAVRELGQTIVMVTHDPVAASYADRAVFLADGRVVGELLDPTSDSVLDAHARPGGLITMFRLAIQTVRAGRARFLLTAMATVLGVAFMAGTLVLTDTIRNAYDGIAATEFASTGAVVQSRNTVDDGQMGTTRGSIPASVVDQVRAVPGVAAADGIVGGSARLIGRDGKLVDAGADQALPIGMAWPSAPSLNPLHLVAGRAPATDDEIVIDRASARDGGFAPGDEVGVLTPSGSARYTVSGVATYGTADDAGGAGVVAFTPATARATLGEPGRVDSVRAVAAAGVTQQQVASRIRAALAGTGTSADYEVLTGRAAVEQARDAAHAGMAFLGTFLMVFAVVALIVGGFVIFNAFSITVAQRTRETAMLRAIGSSRRQVLRMVVAEAVVVGVVASALGTVLGIGLAHGLAALFESFGIELPSGPTVVGTGAVVTAMAVGTVVTVLAAFLPARRASRIAPIAAMRDVAVDSSGTSRRRAVIGTVLAGGGMALIAAGSTSGAAIGLAAGALAVFTGVVVLGPVVAPRFVRVVGTPLAVFRGVTGALARDNAVRNPKRTSATASALTIGVALVVLISVLAASVRASIDANIDSALRSDWVVTPLQVRDGLSPTVERTLDALPETASVTSFRLTPAQLGGDTVQVTGIDPSVISDHIDAGVQAGSLSALGAHELGVREQVAVDNGWHLGDTVTMRFAETGAQRFSIAVLYTLRDPLGDYTVGRAAFDANVAHPVDQALFVTDAPGVSTATARAAIETALGSTPTAQLATPAEFKAQVAGNIDKMLNLIYVLLFLAVVISLFGIANTLALSVVERRRELGLLRAVGMQRRQVRAGVRWEAALIALLGTAVGVALGLGFGWVLVDALSGEGIDHLAVPTVRLALLALAATVAAVLAAALPARRAARLDVLDAITA